MGGVQRPRGDVADMLMAVAAIPEHAFSVEDLAGIACADHYRALERLCKDCRLAEDLVEFLTAQGWATGFWDPPADRVRHPLDSQTPVRTRRYRLTPTGVAGIRELFDAPPSGGGTWRTLLWWARSRKRRAETSWLDH